MQGQSEHAQLVFTIMRMRIKFENLGGSHEWTMDLQIGELVLYTNYRVRSVFRTRLYTCIQAQKNLIQV